MDTEVIVDINHNIISIVKVKPIFSGPKNQYIIESDGIGYSCIEKQEDGSFRFKNWNRDRYIEDKEITQGEVFKIIKECEENPI